MPPIKNSPHKTGKSMLFFTFEIPLFSVMSINSLIYMTKPKQARKTLSENTGKTFCPLFHPRGGHNYGNDCTEWCKIWAKPWIICNRHSNWHPQNCSKLGLQIAKCPRWCTEKIQIIPKHFKGALYVNIRHFDSFRELLGIKRKPKKVILPPQGPLLTLCRIEPSCDYTFKAGLDVMCSSSCALNFDDFPFI